MSLRPFFTLVEHLGLRVAFGALRPKPLFRPSAVLISFSLCGVVYSGCGPAPDSRLTCDPDGKNCFLCDANSCTPANPTVSSSSTGGQGGAGGMVEAGGAGGIGGMGGSGGMGGQTACDPLVTTCGCKETTDCGLDMLCIEGLCVVGCNNSFECSAGKVCVNGKCEVGCSLQNPCDTGETCYKGFCIPDPTNPECTPNKFCPVGQTCVNGICDVSCTTNTNCPAGEVCDSTTGGCIPNPSPIPSCGPSKPCPGTALCGNGGYCQFPCTDVNSCKLIDSRYIACDQNICKVDEEVNPQCSLSKPCPAGQDCVSNKCL